MTTTDDPRQDYVLRLLERMQEKIETLAMNDIAHATEIRSIKEDLKEAIMKLDERVKPVEGFVDHFITANKFIKLLIAAVVTIGGFLSAFAIFKEQIWHLFTK